MKRLMFVAVLLSLLPILTGCSVYFKSDGKKETTVVAINMSDIPVFIDIQARNLDFIREFSQVNPGEPFKKSLNSRLEFRITIAFWAEGFQDALGYTREKVNMTIPGVYTGHPIVITNDMLRGVKLQELVVKNVGDLTRFQDNQGNDCALEHGAWTVFTVISGDNYVFYTSDPRREDGDIRGVTKTYTAKIDRISGNIPWENGKRYDARIVLKERWRRY